MCLIAFAWQKHPDFPLVVSANRDEFYARPTLWAHSWPEHPNIYAGKDLQAGGTWLGISKTGRFAAITNVRNHSKNSHNASSRGELVSNFLISDLSAEKYAELLVTTATEYNGYNLIFCDGHQLYYYSNSADNPQQLSPGIFGLSNALLDTPWPKCSLAKSQLSAWLQEPLCVESLANLLNDRQQAPEHKLPSTGISYSLEKALSAQFIELEKYGTRCSTGILVNRHGTATFFEQSFDIGSKSKSCFQTIEKFWKRT